MEGILKIQEISTIMIHCWNNTKPIGRKGKKMIRECDKREEREKELLVKISDAVVGDVNNPSLNE